MHNNDWSREIEQNLTSVEESEAVERQRRSVSHALPRCVHVLYGGAHLFSEGTFEKVAKISRASYEATVSSGSQIKALLHEQWSLDVSNSIYERITKKLSQSPIEDYRIDFEDGFGVRSEEDEDKFACMSAEALAAQVLHPSAPKRVGIRIKQLSQNLTRRSLKTLKIFVDQYVESRRLSLSLTQLALEHLIITLPKVTHKSQPEALHQALSVLERDHKLPKGFFKIELLIEDAEGFLNWGGQLGIQALIEACSSRCIGLHIGVYDFLSSLDITSDAQNIEHPYCDQLRFWLLLVSKHHPGLEVSDGVINKIPTGERSAVGASWRYIYRQHRRSMALGFNQGWDIHPAQVPIRHVAHCAQILENAQAAVERMKMFVDKFAQASRVGSTFDDRASILGLVNFFEQAIERSYLASDELIAKGVNLTSVKKLIGR
jgi:citrate lyase beta subunit